VRGASTTRMAGNNAETEVNVSIEVPVTDTAIASEV
jgi:hypothetical protein